MMMPVTATVTVTKTQRDSDRDSGSESNHSDIPKQLEPLADASDSAREGSESPAGR